MYKAVRSPISSSSEMSITTADILVHTYMHTYITYKTINKHTGSVRELLSVRFCNQVSTFETSLTRMLIVFLTDCYTLLTHYNYNLNTLVIVTNTMITKFHQEVALISLAELYYCNSVLDLEVL